MLILMIYNKLFYEYFKKDYVKIILFIIILLIINPVQSVLLSRLYGNLFDSIYKNNNKKYNIFKIYENITKFNLPGIIFIICFIYFILFLLYLTRNHLSSIIIPRYFKYTREVIYSHLIKRYSNDYKELKIGEIFSKTFELCMSLGYLLVYFTNFFLPSLSVILALTIYFLFIDYRIGLIYFISCSLIFIYIYLTIDNQTEIANKSVSNLYNNNEKINDKLSNLLNIYINNTENEEIRNLIKDESIHRIKYTRRLWNEKKHNTIVDLIIVISTIIILLLTYYNYNNKKITIVSFISIIIVLGISAQYLFNINGEFSVIIYHYSVILSNKNLLNEIFNLKKHPILKKEINKGEIIFKDISFRYNDKYIIKNFNYKINQGEKLAIIGQSGCGKTTLMKLLINLYDIQSGEILVDNLDIKNIKTDYLRNKIIYVNQKTILFNRTIIENIIYGTNKNKHEVINLINKYDLMLIFNKLPNSIYSNCGVNGSNLSMGMQKVVIILRSIMKDGIIYVYDEPLTSLDSNTRKKVIKMLINELKDKTLIVITHDKEILPYMSKTLKMIKIKN